MKKTLIIAIALLSAALSFGQNRQTAEEVIIDTAGVVRIVVKDTVYVPVYLIDVTDTIQANFVYRKHANSAKLKTMQGYVLVRGVKTIAGGKPVWADNPVLAGGLTKKKKPVKNVISILR